MKRLTERNKGGWAMAACCGKACEYNYCCETGGFSECKGIDDIIDRLAEIEDILGEEYDLDRLQELVDADKDGRCVLLHAGKNSNEDGENALKSAMNTCYYHNNPVTRYIADAVAEKLVRESSNAALVENNDANPQNNYFMNRFMKVK